MRVCQICYWHLIWLALAHEKECNCSLICLQGDIGGPLIAADPKSPEHNQALIGVVRNTRGCPSLTPDFPEVYIKVSAFLDWIKANMNAWILITCRFRHWNINVALKLFVQINKCTSSSQKNPRVGEEEGPAAWVQSKNSRQFSVHVFGYSPFGELYLH